MRETVHCVALLVAVLALGLVAGSAAAQGDGEVGLELEPAETDLEPGESETYELLVDSPDNGILAYEGLVVDVGDETVANITGFEEAHDDEFSEAEILDDGGAVLFEAFVPEEFGEPAEEVLLAEFTVEAVGQEGESTDLDVAGDPTLVDADDEAYEVAAVQNATVDIPVLESEPALSGLEIDSQGDEATVVEGENASVAVDVTNVGNAPGSFEVLFEVGDTTETASTGQLDSGATEAVVVPNATGDLDPGGYPVTAAVGTDEVSGNLTVLADAAFSVSITNTNEPVEGDDIAATFEVTNTGEVADTGTVELATDPALGTSTTTLTLDGGDSTMETLTLPTEAGDAGTYTVTVASPEDSDSESVTVLAEAAFSVTITDTTEPVEGDDLDVTAAVTNTGEVEETQTVTLAAGELGEDEVSVTLGGGESTTETLTVGTDEGDAGAYNATVSTDDATDVTDVSVLEAGGLSVAAVETDGSVVQGQTLSVTVTVENPGGSPVEGALAVDATAVVDGADDAGSNETTIELDPGVTLDRTLTLDTGDGQFGVYDVTASAGSALGETTAEVLLPPVAGDPPQDLDGDGTYKDIRGDGEFSIFDVQGLFDNRDNPVVQDNPAAFNFKGADDPEEVNIFDVQALFNELIGLV